MSRLDEDLRAPLLWLLAPFLGGAMAGASWSAEADGWVVACGIVAAAAAVAAAHRPEAGRGARAVWVVGVCAGGFAAGTVRLHGVLGETPRWRELPARETAVVVEVTRVFAPSPAGGRQSCIGLVTRAPSLVDDLVGQRLVVSIPLACDAAPARLLRGMLLRAEGVVASLAPPAGAGARGGFDGFLWTNGVRFRLSRVRAVTLVRDAPLVARWLDGLGSRCDAILRRGLPAGHPATDAYAAMFLGRTSEMSEQQRTGFARTGTMHLFAISGLHINVISLCLLGVASLARVPPRWAAVVALAVLWVFVEATGGSPSARRAFLMVAFMAAGSVLSKPGNLLSGLVASALAVLAWDPLALRSVSFQLSYAVVAALLLYGAPLRNRLLEAWHPWRLLPEAEWRWWQRAAFHGGRGLLTLGVVSVTASMISMPIGIASFGLGSPGAIAINIVVVPVAGLAITAGFASLACGLAGLAGPCVLFNYAGALSIAAVDAVVQEAADWPWTCFEGHFAAAWMAPAITLGLLVLLAAGCATRWRWPRWSLAVPPSAVVVAVFFLVTPGAPPEKAAVMKSAYELAMERLRRADPGDGPKLSAEQKARLSEIDRLYQSKLAERQIFLEQRRAETEAAGKSDEAAKIREQLASERERLEEEREAEKNRVRRGGA